MRERHAVLCHSVTPTSRCWVSSAGRAARFERAFAEAKAIIASMPGFRSLTLDRCIEQPTRYLLLVEWERLEDHTEGFRGSREYEKWRDLLHHFYEPFPIVEHYEPLTSA